MSNKTYRFVKKDLYVPLTYDEKREAVDELTDCITSKGEIKRKLEGLQEMVKTCKANITTLDDQIENVSFKIKKGSLKPVDCKMILNHDEKIVYTYRLDTMEVVADREMTEDDIELTDQPYEEEGSEVESH